MNDAARLAGVARSQRNDPVSGFASSVNAYGSVLVSLNTQVESMPNTFSNVEHRPNSCPLFGEDPQCLTAASDCGGSSTPTLSRTENPRALVRVHTAAVTVGASFVGGCRTAPSETFTSHKELRGPNISLADANEDTLTV